MLCGELVLTWDILGSKRFFLGKNFQGVSFPSRFFQLVSNVSNMFFDFHGFLSLSCQNYLSYSFSLEVKKKNEEAENLKMYERNNFQI